MKVHKKVLIRIAASALAFVMVLGFSPVAVAHANSTNPVVVVDEHPDIINAQGIRENDERGETSGVIRTGRQITDLRIGNSIVGQVVTENWWEVNTRGTIQGFGPIEMRAFDTSGGSIWFRPPTIFISAQTLPHPATARLNYQADFLSATGLTQIHHMYTMQASGSFDFIRR